MAMVCAASGSHCKSAGIICSTCVHMALIPLVLPLIDPYGLFKLSKLRTGYLATSLLSGNEDLDSAVLKVQQ